MTLQSALRLLDILESDGIMEIDVMGGEPLLLDWMPKFVERAISMNMTVSLSTNGSLTTSLEPFKYFGVERFNIGVSIEGAESGLHNAITQSDNFSSAIESIEKLVSFGLNPIVKTVLSKRTLKEIPKIIKLIESLGATRYYLIHMDVLTKEKAVLNESMSFLEFRSAFEGLSAMAVGVKVGRVNASCFEKHCLPQKTRCAGGARKLFIMPQGDAYPCNLLACIDAFKAGNIFDDGLETIRESPMLEHFSAFTLNECDADDCENHADCTGGCPAHNIYHLGRIRGRDVRCRKAYRFNT